MRDPVTLAIVVTDAPDLHGRLLATLHAALPRVGVLDPCAFVCDLAGTEELLGAPTRIARNVLARCARAGARASAGIAPTPFVARVVAERTPPGEVRLVDDGRAFLAPLPLDVLPVDVKVHDELRLLGLRTVGEFADLPRGSVFDRFGSAVARAHALARGEYGDMVRASAPPRRIRARRAWDDAIGSREQLVFALRVVVDEISGALARDGFAALRLELRLDREDAGPLRIERTVLPPTREAAALLRSLRWALEERSELGLVTGCALEVPEVEPARGRQIGLFAPDGARAEEAIATARYLRAAARARRRRSRAATRARDRMGGGDRMRLFAEPLPAKLVWDEGELVALIVAGHRHTVVEQMRRWRVEADWWKDNVSRDYVTLRTADGLVCDVYGDRRSGAWWLQRVMD